MVAAMHIPTGNDKTAFGLRTTDLRNIAIGLSAVIALVMVAGFISDSGSDSVSAIELDETTQKRFAGETISISLVAGDSTVDEDEFDAGFTVSGVTGGDAMGEAVTVTYGGVTDGCTSHAQTGAYSCNFQGGAGAGGNVAGVADGTITVTAAVSGATTATSFATQDTTDPTTPTVTALTTNDNTPAISGTFNDQDYDTFVVTVNSVDYPSTGSDLVVSSGGTNTWTLTIPSSLSDSTYAVTAVSTDDATNTATDATNNELIVDTAIVTPTVTSMSTNDATPTVAGTLDDADYDTFVCTLNSVTYSVANGAITASNNGADTWSFTVAGGNTLSTGTYNVACTATDDAGNTASDATTGEVVIDATVPTLSVVSIDSDNAETSATVETAI
ncbi:uncharacterized protein METZ01_LOCUS283434, partial [marine metagenome]